MLKEDWQKILMFRKIERGYWRARFLGLVVLFVLICLPVGFYHAFKPMPEGLDYQSRDYIVNAEDIKFLKDLTYIDATGQRRYDQEIFPTIFNYLDQAKQYILVDMFLFNDFLGKNEQVKEKLSSELVNKLVSKKQANPDIRIDVVIDPINTAYGGYDSPQLKALSEAGVNVVVVDLKKLRDEIPVYSAPWRVAVSWLGNSSRHGWLPNLLNRGGQPLTLRSYLAGWNLKADHRKIFLMDNQGELISIIGSDNAQDVSSANSNAALVIKGVFGQEIYKSETAVAVMSGNGLQPLPANLLTPKPGTNQYAQVTLLTEGRIKLAVIEAIDKLTTGDQLELTMFYLADQQVIKTLLKAAARGVDIKIILDPNKNAFGYKKTGIPNQPVAKELVKKSNGKIKIRWYNTTEEQFHNKTMLAVNRTEQIATLIVGSANFTKRNLGNYTLESSVRLITKNGLGAVGEVQNYFKTIWTNAGQTAYTLDYKDHQDSSRLNDFLFQLERITNLTSF